MFYVPRPSAPLGLDCAFAPEIPEWFAAAPARGDHRHGACRLGPLPARQPMRLDAPSRSRDVNPVRTKSAAAGDTRRGLLLEQLGERWK